MSPVTSMRRARPFDLPNVLTYARLVAVPVVAALLFWPDEHVYRWMALGVFVAAAITDYLDGYFARAWAQHSSMGRMLDPIADKLLVAACLLMLVADGTIKSWSIWAAIVILSREILVSGLREFLAELRVGIPVSTVAKWKTAMQLVAIGFLVAGRAADALVPGVSRIGIVLLWIAAILTLYTGWDYLKAGGAYLLDDHQHHR